MRILPYFILLALLSTLLTACYEKPSTTAPESFAQTSISQDDYDSENDSEEYTPDEGDSDYPDESEGTDETDENEDYD